MSPCWELRITTTPQTIKQFDAAAARPTQNIPPPRSRVRGCVPVPGSAAPRRPAPYFRRSSGSSSGGVGSQDSQLQSSSRQERTCVICITCFIFNIFNVSNISTMVSTLQSPTLNSFNQVDIPWFATKDRKRRTEEAEAALPEDPRLWSRAEVQLWVEGVCATHQLPLPDQDRFMMNGKAVCLMSAAMFSLRMPLGGKTLYRDFQIRLAKALNM